VKCKSDQKSVVKNAYLHPLYFYSKTFFSKEPPILESIFSAISYDLSVPNVDIAVLKTEQKFHMPSAALTVLPDDYFSTHGQSQYKRHQKLNRISMAGFGEDNESLFYTSEYYGENHTDVRPTLERAASAAISVKNIFKSQGLFDVLLWSARATVRPGDSGGPLLIQKGRHKKIFGVINGIYAPVDGHRKKYNYGSMITQQNVDWIRYCMSSESNSPDMKRYYQLSLGGYSSSLNQLFAAMEKLISDKTKKISDDFIALKNSAELAQDVLLFSKDQIAMHDLKMREINQMIKLPLPTPIDTNTLQLKLMHLIRTYIIVGLYEDQLLGLYKSKMPQ